MSKRPRELFPQISTINHSGSFSAKWRREINRLDVQVRHAGIKARGSGNEKREEKPRLTDSLLASTPAFC
jgi:hypothetical protein